MFDTRGMALSVHSFDPDECGSADFAEPTTPVAPPAPVAVPDPAEGYREGLARLRSLAEQVRPTTLGVEQVIPVDATLADLFPRGGIARCSVVGLTGPVGVSLTPTLVPAGALEMESSPGRLLVPAAGLALVVLCLKVLGAGLRDALDSRRRPVSPSPWCGCANSR